RVYGVMNPLLAYALALMPLPAFHIPRASGKTTWEPVSTSTSTAAPCFHAEILGFEPPGTPQIQQGYGAMNPLLAYTLALMPLPAFHIPRSQIVLLVVDRQRVRTNPDRSWHPMSSFTFLPFGAKVCPSFLPTKACNRTVALSRTNLVDRPLSPTMEGAPAQGTPKG
ncbi:hypothetical protein THAOC_30340, partial [Thalassiosira oceanica]